MEACPDPIQMRIHIPPKPGVWGLLGYQTGKSRLMIFDWHASLKYRYGKWEFWCRWYLCGHGWKEQENDCGASPQSITARRVIRSKRAGRTRFRVEAGKGSQPLLSGILRPHAAGEACTGRSVLPGIGPYRAEQTTALAGSDDYDWIPVFSAGIHFFMGNV